MVGTIYFDKSIYSRFIKLLAFVVLFFINNVSAQDYYRFEADFSIKTISNRDSSLLIGKVFFDKYKEQIIYEIAYPSKEKWLHTSTGFSKMLADSTIESKELPNLIPYSIFYIALSNEWENYGLKKQKFELKSVNRSDSLVLSEWVSPKEAAQVYQKIILASKKQNLYGIAYISSESKLIRREFFSNYVNIDGLHFPCSIAQINYQDEFTVNQLTNYSNIKINAESN